MAGQTAGLITPRFSEAPPWSGPAIRWYSQACPVCMGDVHEAAADDGWGTCLICARSFPVVELLANARRPGALVIGDPFVASESEPARPELVEGRMVRQLTMS